MIRLSYLIRFWAAAVFLVLMGALVVQSAPAALTGGEPLRTRSGMMVQKPEGYQIKEEGDGRVRITDGKGRQVILWPIPARLTGNDAVSTMAQIETEAKKKARDLMVGDLTQTPDRRSCRYRTRYTVKGKPVEGYAYLTVRGRTVLARVEAPAASFEADFPLLLKIAQTAWVTPPEPAPSLDESKVPTLIARQSPDSASWYAAPPDWSAGGGHMVSGFDNPERTMSIFSRVLNQTSAADTAEMYLRNIVREVDGTNLVIIAASPDSETVEAMRKNNVDGKAMNYYVAYDGHAGPMKGYFGVTEVPLGFGIIFSCFARADLFDQYYPLLISMARSSQLTPADALARQRDIYTRLTAAARTGTPIGDAAFDAMSRARAMLPKDPMATYREYLAGVPEAGLVARIYCLPSTIDPAIAQDPRDGQDAYVPAVAGEMEFADPATFTGS